MPSCLLAAIPRRANKTGKYAVSLVLWGTMSESYFDFERPISELEKKILDLREMSKQGGVNLATEIKSLQAKLKSLIEEIYSSLTPWQRVQLSRHPNRPYAKDYINLIFTDFQELHGDRKFSDDAAIIGGLAKLGDQAVMVIGQEKGRGTKEKIKRNFGMVKPEGYRKAIRLMEMASRFGLPIITFIDTPGAYPGIDAEERGQSEAIADSIMRMFGLEVPVIGVVIGEGGSGGALAIAVADRILMQEYSTYSVISPESCASILWSDSTQSEAAARVLKLSAPEVKELGVIEEIVPEPAGGAHRNPEEAARLLKNRLAELLDELGKKTGSELRKTRTQRFRKMGAKAMISAPLKS